jgi:hypothetical protein
MINHKIKGKNGQSITLFTCDTFTLAVGKDRQETTAQTLAKQFSKKSLESLRALTENQSEQLKLDRAIAKTKGEGIA